MRWLVAAGLLVLAGLATAGVVSWIAVGAPLLGLAIWSVGVASLGSLRRGASYLPDGEPQAVPPEERVTYTCAGCGAEVLLLVRGGAVTPPRHCGERMQERREVSASG